jgi:hypothetical protein
MAGTNPEKRIPKLLYEYGLKQGAEDAKNVRRKVGKNILNRNRPRVESVV